MEKIKQEESFYVDLPKIYTFASRAGEGNNAQPKPQTGERGD